MFGGQLQFHNFVALDNEFSGIEMVQMEGGFGMDNGPGMFALIKSTNAFPKLPQHYDDTLG